jgi:plastocyanin
MKKFITAQLFLFVICIAHITYANSDIVEVDLIIKNHKFEPEILTLPAGKKIRITVYNQDATIEAFESIDLKREKIVLGKSKARVILAPLKPGEYKFFGDFHAETAQGKIIITKETENNV